MLLSTGLCVLPISASIAGCTQTIFLTASTCDRQVALIDSGHPGQKNLILAAMLDHGLSSDALSAIMLTHQDIDHIGSATALRDSVPQSVIVYAHRAEIPFISGRRRLLKLTDEAIEHALSGLPPDLPTERKAGIERALRNPPTVTVDVPVEDGQRLPVPGNPLVICTPGHTPGHISLFFEQSSTLVAGDCLVAGKHELMLPDERLCADYSQAIESVRKLMAYELRNVICYHGGIVSGNIRSQLGKLL